MPLLDSFTVDHTIMAAPAVRVAKTMKTPHGDTITVFDLRFCRPNKEILTERGIHTLEHLFAGFMRNRFLHEPDRHAGRAARGQRMERSHGRCSEGEGSESDP